MTGPLRNIAVVTLRWAGAWAILGLVVGVALTLGRFEPIAESGARPLGLGPYTFWIPLGLGVASVFGLLLGFMFACLMAVVDLWWSPTKAKPGWFAAYGQRLLCGAVAGGLIGWPLMRDGNALIFVGLGLGSSALSSYLNRPKKQSQKSES
jgi:hypothetical protein